MPDLMPAEPVPFAIRPARPEDAAFIFGSWLENFWRESPWAARLTARTFFGPPPPAPPGGHRAVVVAVLARARVLVACDLADPDEIVGYFVFEPGVAHWLYVKKALRGFGVARALLAASDLPTDLAGVRITHPTRSWLTTRAHGPGLEAKYPLAVNDPYPALNPGATT